MSRKPKKEPTTARNTSEPEPSEAAKRAAGVNLGGAPRVETRQISHVEAIRTMAGYGLTQQMMADILGWSHDTFTRRKQEDPDVQRALTEGRAAAAFNVGEALYNKAVGWRGRAPETSAIRWYEITRLGMKDRVVVEGDRENPLVTEVRQMTTKQKARRLEDLVGKYSRAPAAANGRNGKNGKGRG